jgi:hypothetical protein
MVIILYAESKANFIHASQTSLKPPMKNYSNLHEDLAKDNLLIRIDVSTDGKMYFFNILNGQIKIKIQYESIAYDLNHFSIHFASSLIKRFAFKYFFYREIYIDKKILAKIIEIKLEKMQKVV